MVCFHFQIMNCARISTEHFIVERCPCRKKWHGFVSGEKGLLNNKPTLWDQRVLKYGSKFLWNSGDVYDWHSLMMRIVYKLCTYKQQIIQPEIRLLIFWGFFFKLHHFISLEVICIVLCAPVLPKSDCRLYQVRCHVSFMCT